MEDLNKQIESRVADIDRKVEKLQEERAELVSAAEVFARLGGTSERPTRKRRKSERKPVDERKRQVNNYLLAHNRPSGYSPRDIAVGAGIPESTAYRVVEMMLADGDLEVTGYTPRGSAVVKLKPVTAPATV